ncbi:sensor histidine kinase KdpD [Porphyrobacter sp. GA68]|uniref:sensor histidine kinase n=1 Tax=Porphyrobacter sp. GA68 TaxID=2883480 RepID=UPI001D180CF3|nr:HAMP domain-containing sensor histidine kinase [Porphyrobacter sp. GA68]
MTRFPQDEQAAAQGLSDADDRLIRADQVLLTLQQDCGGTMPGTIAIPELLSLVRRARAGGLRMTRPFTALTNATKITGLVELAPSTDPKNTGCAIRLLTWQAQPRDKQELAHTEDKGARIKRQLAEMTVRLDPAQNIISVEAGSSDLELVKRDFTDGLGQPWTRFVTLDDGMGLQPVHWRLLDGATCRLKGSNRTWQAHLDPIGNDEYGAGGFNLSLVALTPLTATANPSAEEPALLQEVATSLLPSLHGPVSRIIENAGSIKRRLAGPVSEEYSDYAADIIAAGRHLQMLVGDLEDLQQIDADQLALNIGNVDLADTARTAARLLSGQARERGVNIVTPSADKQLCVRGDQRRVLQVLLNLLSNAIKYGPASADVRIQIDCTDGGGAISVTDQGAGISPEEQQQIFGKYERLGRTDAQGLGLGLYIAQRLAQAMQGKLWIDSTPDAGTRFVMALPLAE